MRFATLPQRSDLMLAGALAVVGVVGTAGTDGMTGVDERVDALAFTLMVGGALTTAFRRRLPLVTLAVVAVLTSAYLVLGYPYGPIFFPFFVAVYTAAAHRPPAAAARTALGALAVLLTHLFTNDAALAGFAGVVPASAWVVVPFAVGVTVRLTREAREREQAEAVRRRVYDERLRIAQEVHDVVGHGLVAIKMQADVALHVLPNRPEQAERALSAISRTSTEALEEVRATLGVVRQAADADRAPPPGLGHLDGLRRRMAEAGMRVDIDTIGIPRELPAAVELAGYRMVQESLTNVLRHGERKIADVRIAYDTDAIVIAISNPMTSAPMTSKAVTSKAVASKAVTSKAEASDPATGAPGERTGYGINGMAERVTALGGEFSAGPTGDGRFEVRASIPTGGPAGGPTGGPTGGTP